MSSALRIALYVSLLNSTTEIRHDDLSKRICELALRCAFAYDIYIDLVFIKET